jgi:fatty acid-binding protein DegV
LTERCSTVEAACVSKNPTVELLCLWLSARLSGIIASARQNGPLKLDRIRVQEGSDGSAAAWWRAEAG